MFANHTELLFFYFCWFHFKHLFDWQWHTSHMSRTTSIQSALQVVSVLLWELSLLRQSYSHLFLSSFNLETASNLLREAYSFQSNDSHTVWCQDVTQMSMSLRIHSVNLISRSKTTESESIQDLTLASLWNCSSCRDKSLIMTHLMNISSQDSEKISEIQRADVYHQASHERDWLSHEQDEVNALSLSILWLEWSANEEK